MDFTFKVKWKCIYLGVELQVIFLVFNRLRSKQTNSKSSIL